MNVMIWIGALGVLSLSSVAAHPSRALAATAPAIRTAEIVAGEAITVRSRVLDEERTLLIRTPRGYDADTRRYPVLFVLDADWHFNVAAAEVEFLSECSYLSTHPAPPLIVVGVMNVDRNRDFTPTHCVLQRGMSFPTSGRADTFRRFLVEEVVPLIDERYRTVPFRILAGWSLGGLFAIQTLLDETPVFDSYLAISPSLWWDDAVTLRNLRSAGSTSPSPGARQLVATLGSAEVANNTSVAASTRAFLDHLKANPLQHVSVDEVVVEGFGHNLAPVIAYVDGLATIFADMRLPPDTLEKGLAAVDAYYQALGERYRYAIPVPEDVYGTLGWRLLEQGKEADARAVFQRWIDRHPNSSVAVASLGSFCRETGDQERAVALLRQAIALEERSAQPRENFILDLKRDIAALRQDDAE